MDIVDRWHITEMETWDESYFNMAAQAYIEIKQNGLGHFQFGLVSGQLEGEIEKLGNVERFFFTWDGVDEMDHVSGSGWLQPSAPDKVEGKIKLHSGDSSLFSAQRAA